MLSDEQMNIIREIVEETEPDSEDKDVTVLSLSLILDKEDNIEKELDRWKSLFNAMGDKQIDEDAERWFALIDKCRERIFQ